MTSAERIADAAAHAARYCKGHSNDYSRRFGQRYFDVLVDHHPECAELRPEFYRQFNQQRQVQP